MSEETFSDSALKLLGSQFQGLPYRLYVSIRDIPVGPNRAAALGRTVAEQVIAQSPVIAEKGVAKGRTPIPWEFHRLTQRDAECDYGPLHGVMVELEGSTGADLMSVTREDLKQNEVALGQMIETRLGQAAAKFDSYPKALKVVLLDFIGDDDFLLDDDIRRLVGAARCPDEIDQVWVSEQEWVSLTDWEPVFRQVR